MTHPYDIWATQPVGVTSVHDAYAQGLHSGPWLTDQQCAVMVDQVHPILRQVPFYRMGSVAFPWFSIWKPL